MIPNDSCKAVRKSVSLNPSFPWALAAVIGQMRSPLGLVYHVQREWQPMGGHYTNVLLRDVQP